MKPPKKLGAPETVGFRLDPENGELLRIRADSLGVSVHELARTYMLETLHEERDRAALYQGLIHLRDEVKDLRNDFSELREDMALSIQALLVRAGKVSAKEAMDWVDTQLRPKY